MLLGTCTFSPAGNHSSVKSMQEAIVLPTARDRRHYAKTQVAEQIWTHSQLVLTFAVAMRWPLQFNKDDDDAALTGHVKFRGRRNADARCEQALCHWRFAVVWFAILTLRDRGRWDRSQTWLEFDRCTRDRPELPWNSKKHLCDFLWYRCKS